MPLPSGDGPFDCQAIENLDVPATPVLPGQGKSGVDFTLGTKMWKRRRRWLLTPGVQVCFREYTFADHRLTDFNSSKYTNRLRDLHPGIRRDIDDSLELQKKQLQNLGH